MFDFFLICEVVGNPVHTRFTYLNIPLWHFSPSLGTVSPVIAVSRLHKYHSLSILGVFLFAVLVFLEFKRY